MRLSTIGTVSFHDLHNWGSACNRDACIDIDGPLAVQCSDCSLHYTIVAAAQTRHDSTTVRVSVRAVLPLAYIQRPLATLSPFLKILFTITHLPSTAPQRVVFYHQEYSLQQKRAPCLLLQVCKNVQCNADTIKIYYKYGM